MALTVGEAKEIMRRLGRAEPVATRSGELVEQVGHWMVRTMRGDEVVARKRSAPIALAARHNDALCPRARP
jgi:hypothetical protein